MTGLFDRYQKGYHQEVYDELLAMHEGVFEEDIYEDALLVARAMMRRVCHNIELLIPRLHEIGYQFGKGGFGRSFLLRNNLHSLPSFSRRLQQYWSILRGWNSSQDLCHCLSNAGLKRLEESI